MKKLTALITVLCLFVSLIPFAVFAEEMVLKADAVLEGGEGVGYHDSAAEGLLETSQINGETVVRLRENEWAAYDIEGLSQGTYQVSVNAGATGTCFASVSVDEQKLIGYTEFSATGDINVLNEKVLGNVYIYDGAKVLKLINDKEKIYTSNSSFNFDNIKLTYIGENPDFNMSATNVLPGGEGVGSHSDRYVKGQTSTSPEKGADCSANSSICLRHSGQRDWVKYDISYLPQGTYGIKMTNACVSNINATITIENENGKEYTTTLTVPKSNSKNYTTFATTDELCQVFIREGSKTLKIGGQNSTYNLKNIGFEFLSEENLSLVSEMEIFPANVYSSVSGVGFYDNSGSGVWEVGTLGGRTEKFIIFRSGEWGKYDISTIKSGRYCLISNASNTSQTNFTVTIDDEEEGVTIDMPSTGSWGNLTDCYSPIFEIEDGDLHLKITSGSQPIYSYKFTLKAVPEFEVLEVSGDIMSDNDLVKRGSGLVTVSFSTDLASKDEVISLKDAEGKDVDSTVSVEGKNVNICLNEPLKASEEYSVNIKNLKDVYGQNIENDAINFTTTDETDEDGGGQFDVSSWIYDDRVFEISGVVYSTQNVVLKNKKVRLDVVDTLGETTTKAETLSKTDGSFAMSYTFPEDTKSGAYKVVLAGDAMGDVKEEYIANFFDEAGEKEFVESFENKSVSEIKDAVSNYSEILNLDTERMEAEIEDLDAVYASLQNKAYKTSEEIITALNGAIYKEYVNGAENEDELLEIYNEFMFRKYMGIDSKYLDLLTAEETAKLITDLNDGKTYSTALDIADRINAKVNSLLCERYIVDADIKATSKISVTEGQIGTISVAFENEQVNIAEVVLNIKMKDADFFEDENVEVVEEDNVVLDSEKIKDGVLEIKLLSNGNVTELCEIKITAPKASAGSYELEILGKAYLSFKETGKYLIESNEFTKQIASFEVKKMTQGSGKYSGSSSGGGSGSGSSSKVPTYPSIPVQKEETAQTPDKTQESSLPKFRDLAGFDWAENAILALAEKNIISGRGDAIFAPGDNITRSEFCKMISLAFDISTEGAECNFKDVDENSWSYKYIAAAYNAKIINGVSETEFAGEKNLSREDMAVIIYRIIAEGKKASKDVTFTDAEQISDYAKDAVSMLCEMGIVNGMGNNTFSPKTVVTRAQAAQIIYKAMNTEV